MHGKGNKDRFYPKQGLTEGEDLSKVNWASSWDYGSLFAYMKYGSRRKVQPKIRYLAPLDGCAFEEWVYGGRKVP